MPSLQACLEHARKPEDTNKQYVVQPHVPNAMLSKEGRKFTVRVYALIYSPPGPERKIEIYVYNNGYFAPTKEKWSMENYSRESQISTNRDLSMGRLADWEHYDLVFPKLFRATGKVLYAAATEFFVQRKRTYEVFGLDFMLSKEGKDGGSITPYLLELEVNSGPVTKEEDYPMLRGIVKILLCLLGNICQARQPGFIHHIK